MPSKAERAAARVDALLAGAVAPPWSAVFRDRQDALTREEAHAVLIECVDEDTQPVGGGSPFPLAQKDRDDLRLAVTQCVRSANWQSVADAGRVAAHALIVADAELRGFVAEIARDRCDWRPASADVPFGYCSQVYRITYLTPGHALDASL